MAFQDDLAASSYYEAVLYEDPSFDANEYFSDWEYYSDDYYDDDQTAEKSAERKKRTDKLAKAKRRTKGSSRTTTTVPTKSPLYPDIATFQGVLWKTPALDRDQDVAILYEPDTGDKVSLLENWREVFKLSQPALDRSKLTRRRVDIKPGEADNETLADNKHNSSDDSSGGDSLDSSAIDTGDASNTTPDPESDVAKLMPSPRVVIPVMKGRKRKAVAQEAALEEDALDGTPTSGQHHLRSENQVGGRALRNGKRRQAINPTK